MIWFIAVSNWLACNLAILHANPAPIITEIVIFLIVFFMARRQPNVRPIAFVGALSSSLQAWSFQIQQPSKSWHEHGEPMQSEGVFSFVRAAFIENLNSVSKDAGALVAGLAIGDDSSLSASLAEQMKLVGLTHLTAVSGANCAIVIAMTYLILKKLSFGRWLRTFIALLALIGYVQLVGPQPSVIRAAMMAALVLVVVASGRKKSSMGALSLAVVLLLIADPWLSSSYGFALSAAATAGILVLAPVVYERLKVRLPNWLALGLSVSFAAQLACWPILLQLQDGISTYSLLANLLAEPLVAPVTILGLSACLISPVFPGLAATISWVASCLSWVIGQIASKFSALPATTLDWPSGWLGQAFAVAILASVVVWLRFKTQRMRATGAAVSLLSLAIITGSSTAGIVQSNSWMSGYWDVVSCDVGQGDATVIRSNSLVALIDVGRDDRSIDECLSQLGTKTIDLLVLSHFDLDHVGGLSGAISGRLVGKVLISDFEDDRPAVAKALSQLRKQSITPIEAFKGVAGQLGQLSWRVLNPRKGGYEAEDSNDGSLAMQFVGPDFDVLALADLGERGQMRIASEIGSSDSTAKPLILKVSHHGSADQFAEFHESLAPDIALISVGKSNSYGHPTTRTLSLLTRVGSTILRTDQLGSIALSIGAESSQGNSTEIKVSG